MKSENWQNKIPKNKAEQEGFLVLVQGEDNSGSEQWAYALIHPEKLMDFKIAEASENGYILEDFGKVLSSGSGKNPSQEIIDEMKERYGADENFEENFVGAIKDIFDS